jgi:hypothetical protein
MSREVGEGMLGVLAAGGPDPEFADQMMLYGRFVGAWDGTVIVHARDGGRRVESCEVYFGWVLQGRAIQDVWIAPARKDRTDPSRPSDKDIYGTTLRVYDRENDVWHITWIEPNTLSFERLTGRQEGEDIVQEYQDDDGTRWQWCFTEIRDRSFRWLARSSGDDGASWQVRNEFLLSRRDGTP